MDSIRNRIYDSIYTEIKSIMTKENEIDLMQDIKEHINVVCELLEINPPKIIDIYGGIYDEN